MDTQDIAPRQSDPGSSGGGTAPTDSFAVAEAAQARKDAAELAALRAEKARTAAAAAAPSAPATIALTEDRLAAIIAAAVAQGRKDAALATGARPERAEEVHSDDDGDCLHPLSAHEFFGEDGYGRCHVDGCACTGRELGIVAVRALNKAARAKAQAPAAIAA